MTATFAIGRLLRYPQGHPWLWGSGGGVDYYPSIDSIDLIRDGFNTRFMGNLLVLPWLATEIQNDAVIVDDSEVVDYTHFSLSMSRSRRLARWVAWNIDGMKIRMLSHSGLGFGKDPRIPSEYQIGNELYSNNSLDRGHLARRGARTWGDEQEAWQANRDSFFFTKIAPQHEGFKQSVKAGLWGDLENPLLEAAAVDVSLANVFAGPVFSCDDPIYHEVQIPLKYWKIIMYRVDDGSYARAFVLEQEVDFEESTNDYMISNSFKFEIFQIGVAELEQQMMLHFSSAIHEAGDGITGKFQLVRAAGKFLLQIYITQMSIRWL